MRIVSLAVCMGAALCVVASSAWSSRDSTAASASGLPAACDASIRTFHTWDMATVRANNGARAVRQAILAFVDGALRKVSNAKVAQLVAAYNKATNAQTVNVLSVSLTAKVYTAQRPKCVAATVAAPCRTLLGAADSLTALNRTRAMPVINETEKVSTSFAAMVRSHDTGYQQLNGLLDRLTALAKSNTAYNTKRSPLVAQYNRALPLCYAT